MKYKSIVFLCFAGFLSNANAGPVGSIGIIHTSHDGPGVQYVSTPGATIASVGVSSISYSLTGLYLSGGYQFDIAPENLSLIPEIRLGTGVGNDTWDDNTSLHHQYDVKLKSYYGFDLRAEWRGERAYVYLAPGYIHTRITATSSLFSLSKSESAFSAGIGAGYRLMDDLRLEGSWERRDGDDWYGIGLQYRFSN